MAKKEKPTGIKVLKLTYADLETENRIIRSQLEQRDARLAHLAEQRDQEIRSRVAAQEQAKTANQELAASRQNNGILKDLLLETQLDRARLEGYRDRVEKLDMDIARMRGARISDAEADRYNRPGKHLDLDWVNRS